MIRSVVLALSFALAFFGAGSALAQAAGLRADNELGISLSEDNKSKLHLGIDAGAGFDTNPYSTPFDAGFAGDITARVRPYAEVNVPGSLLAFKGRAALDYGFLPGVVEAETRSFLLYQLDTAADLEVNRGGMFTFAVGDTVSWNSDPGVAVIGSLLNRIHNQLRAGVGMTPGGGTLQLRLGYAFDFTKYIDVQGNGGLIADGVLDSMRHGVTLRTDYRFLPKTGVFGTVRLGWQSYPFDTTQTPPNAFPLDVVVGVQGNVLPKLAGLLSLGYSNPFVVDATGLTTGTVIGVTGQAEVQWAPTPTTKLGGGFQRKFDPIALYGYIGNSRFYGSLNQSLLGRFGVGLNVGYSLLEFGDEVAAGQPLTDRPTGRFDTNLDVGVKASYYFLDWLSAGISNNFDWRTTNANDISAVEAGEDPLNLGYIRNTTLLFASVRY